MEYPDDAFHTFLCLDSVNYLAVNGTVTRVRVLGGQWIFLLKLENQNRESSVHSFFDLILKVEK